MHVNCVWQAMKLTVNEALLSSLETMMPGARVWALEFIAGGGGGASQVWELEFITKLVSIFVDKYERYSVEVFCVLTCVFVDVML